MTDLLLPLILGAMFTCGLAWAGWLSGKVIRIGELVAVAGERSASVAVRLDHIEHRLDSLERQGKARADRHEDDDS